MESALLAAGDYFIAEITHYGQAGWWNRTSWTAGQARNDNTK
jgi:hypothetical protein